MHTAALPELQAWFLAVMTAPGGLRPGMGVGSVLVDGPGATPESRMNIYAHGYVLRLLECLRVDYPLLRKVMGDAAFSLFARAYIAQHPSVSPSLYDLGAGFAPFLAASQGASGGDALMVLPIELARLERARMEAGRAPGLEKACAGQAGPIDPLALMLGQEVTVWAPSCLRLLELALPLLPFATALGREDQVPAPPTLEPGFAGVTRMRYQVQAHALEAWQFHFLHVLVQQEGRPVPAHTCLAHAAARTGQALEQLMVDFIVWLPRAAAWGLLAVQAENAESAAYS